MSRDAAAAEEMLVVDQVFGEGDGLVADAVPVNDAAAQLRGLAQGNHPVTGTTWTVRGLLLCLRFSMWLKPSDQYWCV